MGDVIEFQPPNANAQCPVCGCQWWNVEAIVLDHGGSPVGYAGEPTCHDCGVPQ